MTNIERESSSKKDGYKERILEVLENRAMSAREIAKELDIDIASEEFFGKFLETMGRLEGGGKEKNLAKAKLQLAKRQSDEKFVYYRKEDEDELISKGLLGPEYSVRSIRDHYKSVEEIKDLMA